VRQENGKSLTKPTSADPDLCRGLFQAVAVFIVTPAVVESAQGRFSSIANARRSKPGKEVRAWEGVREAAAPQADALSN
jgi:hypothetical protein